MPGHLLCCTILSIIAAGVIAEDPARRLYNKLILADYQPTLRPRKNYSKEVNVTVSFTLLKLVDIGDINQVMNVVGFLGITWTDDYLKWNPKDYAGIKKLTVNRFDIWTPDVTVRDTTRDPYAITKKEFDYLTVNHRGEVAFNPVGELELLCPLNIRYFPFDEHVCAIALGNWVLTSDEQTLFPGAVEMRSLAAHIHWRILAANMHRYCYGNGEYQYDMLRIYFRLERKAKYVVINFILPVVILTVLSVTNYIVPLDHDQRINMSMVILLSYVVFQLALVEIMPRTSDNFPYIAILIFTEMGLLCASITMDSILQWLAAEKGQTDSGIFHKLHKGSYKYATVGSFCRFCCLKRTDTEEDQVGCCHSLGIGPKISLENGDNDETVENGEKAADPLANDKTWNDVALMLDRYFFHIYLAVLIFVNVMFFFLVMLHPQAHLPASGKCPGFTWNVVDKLDLAETIESTYDDKLPNLN